jgi:hypothetical protein
MPYTSFAREVLKASTGITFCHPQLPPQRGGPSPSALHESYEEKAHRVLPAGGVTLKLGMLVLRCQPILETQRSPLRDHYQLCYK